ncbi:hypothetical protein [Pedobacter changchengzhani]|uniref:hypothetical protein n=1 Tax=Pedobacter changchengzhani TaxID=2529274 RepID=UPI0014044C58|nr:hypothetical protein [Pedobacter changchengzhani]
MPKPLLRVGDNTNQKGNSNKDWSESANWFYLRDSGIAFPIIKKLLMIMDLNIN